MALPSSPFLLTMKPHWYGMTFLCECELVEGGSSVLVFAGQLFMIDPSHPETEAHGPEDMDRRGEYRMTIEQLDSRLLEIAA